MINTVNNMTPDVILRYTAYLHTSPGELAIVAVLLLCGLLLNYFIKSPFRRVIKAYLYSRRRETVYRMLFLRIELLVHPLRLLLNLFFLKTALDIFSMSETMDNIFYILYLIVIGWWTYELVKLFFYIILSSKIKKQRSARRELFSLFLNITRVFISFVLIMLVLTHMGINVTALITSLGIGGAIIGLSAKDTLTNFFDSIRLVSEDVFRHGDWIETAEVEGFVTEMGLTSTKIRTFDNAMVTVPNTVLANNYVKNWTKRMVGRRIKFRLKLKYSSDIREIEKVVYEIREMLDSHPDIVNEKKLPYLMHMRKTYEDGLFNLEDKYGVRRTLLVYLDEIGDYSMNILIYAFSISVNWEEWLGVKQDVIKKIITIIDESDLQLALPRNEVMLTKK